MLSELCFQKLGGGVQVGLGSLRVVAEALYDYMA